MKKKRVLILEKERIAHKVRRMGYEIWEHNSSEKEITLIGIKNGGKILADNLAKIIKEVSPLKVHTIALALNKKKPLHKIEIEEDLTGRSVILVDDVVSSGKTMMYAVPAILAYDLKKLMVAVLVDRKHKSFPINADIVGHSVATTLQEHIEMETEGSEITAVYLE